MTTRIWDEAPAPRGLRWRVVGVATLVSAATAGWLLGSGALQPGPTLGAHLLFTFGLGAASYLAIDQLVRRTWSAASERASEASDEAQPAEAGAEAEPLAAHAPPHALAHAPPHDGSAVSHDINNMLSAISGHAEIALRQPDVGDAARGELQGIARAVERCARLTRQLALRAGDGILLPQPFELNTLVLEMRPMLSRLIGEGLQLVLVPGAASSLVMADETQVERLVLNLAVNARDAMPSGGVLRILTENVERPPDPEHSDPGGLGVALVVQDTGRGMDTATRTRLFEPGFSTRHGGRRRGLGLSIVAEVARQCSASIDCQTAPGRGTTFRVLFPLALGAASAEPPELVGSAVAAAEARGLWRERRATSRGPDRRNRVLVIDDDSEVRRVVQGLLESAGFQVMSAPDGEQGLALLEWSMADAVLCDIFMPNKEGIETCTELRRRYPALRVVAMSGASGATGYLRAAEKLGAVASLRKPFTGQELVAVVQGALAGRFSG